MKRPPEEGDKIVTAFRDGQVTLRERRREEGFTNALQEIGYQRVIAGDLVIHAMDAFAGAIGVSASDGKSTPVYSVCTSTGDADAHYFALLLRHMALSGSLQLSQKEYASARPILDGQMLACWTCLAHSPRALTGSARDRPMSVSS
jgi:type I restriction enzyme S subunit